MALKKRRELTPAELAQLSTMAGLGLNHEGMAALFGMSRTWFDHLLKKHDSMRLALATGIATSSVNLRQTAYQIAIGDPQALKPPNASMLRFLLQTREGFTIKAHVELTGANGGPVVTQDMTPAQRKDYLKKMRDFLDATEDEDGKTI